MSRLIFDRRVWALCTAGLVLAAALAGCAPDAARTAALKVGDPARGRMLIGTLGCGACHRIPGVPDAVGLVGPPLDQAGRRTIIAGLLPNTPEHMVHWLKAPQSVTPGNAMPDMAIDDRDAHDMAAYLYTLR
jgi:cytochrome c2